MLPAGAVIAGIGVGPTAITNWPVEAGYKVVHCDVASSRSGVSVDSLMPAPDD
jgi:hypothetical protein